jgi:hypothetical protein
MVFKGEVLKIHKQMLELKQGKKKADEEITLSEVQKPGNAALPRPNALELQQTAQLTNLSQVEVI